ncbi:MAG: RecQ family ATP-dependent DNA helicase [Chloroflexota bacterium]|nr:RecQ family ATP-dependent DNA helicase [Chloroflexota bacterium]
MVDIASRTMSSRTPSSAPSSTAIRIAPPTLSQSHADIHALLQQRFALDGFRPGQEEIIRALMAGRDVMAVLPTGGGKSLVYQLAAQLLPGVTIVVSPLLALMQDQVDSLEARGVEVGVINSTQSARQADHELELVQQEEAKLLYVTPERFQDAEFLAQIQGLEVSLLVVDEAHCISEWGHSFRPAYLRLGRVAEQLGRPALLALTATASPWVRRDIVERLRMHDPAVVVRGSDRPNLFLEVLRVEEEREDRRVLQRLLTEPADPGLYGEELGASLTAMMHGSGIVYTATTEGARETASWLQEWGIAADYYHGQRRKSDRERVQRAFMGGELRVIAATNAFGLGVDKPDVRFVVHRDTPACLESYYQEAGRGGRDGRRSRCVLIYRAGDLGRAAFLGASGHLTQEAVATALGALHDRPHTTERDLAEATGLGRGNLQRLLDLLERHGVVAVRHGDWSSGSGAHSQAGDPSSAGEAAVTEETGVRLLRPDVDPDEVPLEGEERRRAHEHSRLEMMRGYAELGECRREYILNYLGETYDAGACTLCDNSVRGCLGSAASGGAFVPGEPVEHPAWGGGAVQRLKGDTVTVLFDAVGYKTLSLPGVLEQDLLRKPPDHGIASTPFVSGRAAPQAPASAPTAAARTPPP